MFDFWRITPILFGIPVLKAQNDYVLKFWGAWPIAHPCYAYAQTMK